MLLTGRQSACFGVCREKTEFVRHYIASWGFLSCYSRFRLYHRLYPTSHGSLVLHCRCSPAQPLALRLHRWLSGKASLAPPCLNTRDSHIQCLRRCYLSGQRCTWQGWNHALQFTSQHRSKSSLPRSQLIHYLILFYPCHLSIIAGAARLLTVAFRSLGHSMRQRA
jgi:hypothetical protein